MLIEAIGAAQFEATEKDCIRAAGATTSAMKRMQPRGAPEDTIETLEWVPSQWKAANSTPEALRELGAPHCVAVKTGCFVSAENWPSVGVGQFVVIGRGQVTLCVWPGKDILGRGCTVRNQWSFLFHEMTPKTFSEWASSVMMVTEAPEKSVAWIPYGWYAAAIATPSDSASAALMIQPCVSHTMASRCPVWPSASEFLQTFLTEKVSANVSTYVQ